MNKIMSGYKRKTLRAQIYVRQAGFTLVEMLVSMFIFSIISIGTMGALTSTIASKDQIKTRMDALAKFETGRAIILTDMANIRLRENRDAYGNNELYLMSGGVNDLLNFTRGGRDNPGGILPRSDLQRVRYVFEDGQLIRRVLAHENPSPVTPEFDRVLMDDLVSADIEFIIGDQIRTIYFKESLAPPNGQIETGNTPDSEPDNNSDNETPLPDMIRLETLNVNGDRLVQYFELGS